MPARGSRRSSKRYQIVILAALFLLSLLIPANSPVTVAQAPTLTITPDIVSCTTRVTARGEGFVPGSEVIVSTGEVDEVPTSIFQGFWGR